MILWARSLMCSYSFCFSVFCTAPHYFLFSSYLEFVCVVVNLVCRWIYFYYSFYISPCLFELCSDVNVWFWCYISWFLSQHLINSLSLENSFLFVTWIHQDLSRIFPSLSCFYSVGFTDSEYCDIVSPNFRSYLTTLPDFRV